MFLKYYEQIERIKRKIIISSAIKLLFSISITMFLVILYVKFICIDDCKEDIIPQPMIPFGEKTDSKTQKTINAFLNALLIVIYLAVGSSLVVLLFYFRCDKLILGYLMFAFFMIFVLHASIHFKRILNEFNLAFDIISGSLLLWNYSVLGQLL